MTSLSNISGISAETADLLSAAGIRSCAHLSREDASRLHSRLEMLAWQRGRAALTPPVEYLEQWIAVAKMMTPDNQTQGLDLDDIPEAITTPAGAAWMPPALRAAQSATADPGGNSSARTQAAAPDNTWRKVDPARFATIEEYNEGRISVQPLSRESLAASVVQDTEGEEEDEDDSPAPRRTQRIRSKGEELSRWVRRGVVHPRPVHTWLGALVSLLWRVALVSGIAGFLYFIFEVDNQSAYKTEVIAGFAVLVVLGCMQLHFVGRSRCRICSCNLFYSKNCLKNRKAHHIPGMGYVASLSLHLLIFGWFRCMYCGTAVRLKSSADKE